MGVDGAEYLLDPRAKDCVHNVILSLSRPPEERLKGLAEGKISGQGGRPQVDRLNGS